MKGTGTARTYPMGFSLSIVKLAAVAASLFIGFGWMGGIVPGLLGAIPPTGL